jgi:hypothetical protein
MPKAFLPTEVGIPIYYQPTSVLNLNKLIRLGLMGEGSRASGFNKKYVTGSDCVAPTKIPRRSR